MVGLFAFVHICWTLPPHLIYVYFCPLYGSLLVGSWFFGSFLILYVVYLRWLFIYLITLGSSRAFGSLYRCPFTFDSLVLVVVVVVRWLVYVHFYHTYVYVLLFVVYLLLPFTPRSLFGLFIWLVLRPLVWLVTAPFITLVYAALCPSPTFAVWFIWFITQFVRWIYLTHTFGLVLFVIYAPAYMRCWFGWLLRCAVIVRVYLLLRCLFVLAVRLVLTAFVRLLLVYVTVGSFSSLRTAGSLLYFPLCPFVRYYAFLVDLLITGLFYRLVIVPSPVPTLTFTVPFIAVYFGWLVIVVVTLRSSSSLVVIGSYALVLARSLLRLVIL